MNSVNQPKTTETENMIDVRESWDVNFWCEEFNLRAEELKEIVKNVGPMVHDVRVHLAKKSIITWPLAY